MMPRQVVRKKRRTPSAREQRLFVVEEEIQALHNIPFTRGDYKTRFRFAQGSPVLSLSRGVYYEAHVSIYYRSVIPDSLHPPGTELPFAEWIPTALIRFVGWTAKYNEEVPENELFSRNPTDLAAIQGMLFAHEWNTFHRERLGLSEEETGNGSWYLDDNTYTELEQVWKTSTGNDIGFAEYCGRFVTEPMEIKEQPEAENQMLET